MQGTRSGVRLPWLLIIVAVALFMGASSMPGDDSDSSVDDPIALSEIGPNHSLVDHEVTLSVLTPREVQVVLAVGDGKTTAQIAESCGMAVRTVECHIRNAYRKLGVHSRVELVRRLVRTGHLRL